MMQKNKDFIIVPMEERHVPQIAELERQCFSTPWTEEMIQEELKNDCTHYFVAEQADKVYGYIGVQVVLDEGYITNVAVAQNVRRQGIAKRLLDTLCKQMKSLAFLTLEVRAGNIPAIALYEIFGFQRVGIRKNYYTKPSEDAILMTKWLQSGGEQDENISD